MPVITVKKNNTYTTDELYQWDTNRILEIYGLNLEGLPEIHYANSKMSKALVKLAKSNTNGVIKVDIPNALLETAAPIRVFVCTYEGEEFISRYSFSINVKARPKPEDYYAEDDEKIYSYNALESLVNNTVIELREENSALYDDMVEAMAELRAQVETESRDADTLGGYSAEDFELSSKPGKTVFNPDGSITTNYNDGSTETVKFNADGTITTARKTAEMGVKTETVYFNSDGSITVTVA